MHAKAAKNLQQVFWARREKLFRLFQMRICGLLRQSRGTEVQLGTRIPPICPVGVWVWRWDAQCSAGAQRGGQQGADLGAQIQPSSVRTFRRKHWGWGRRLGAGRLRPARCWQPASVREVSDFRSKGVLRKRPRWSPSSPLGTAQAGVLISPFSSFSPAAFLLHGWSYGHGLLIE